MDLNDYRSHVRALLAALILLCLAWTVEVGSRAYATWQRVDAILTENVQLRQQLQAVVQQANQVIAQLQQQNQKAKE